MAPYLNVKKSLKLYHINICAEFKRYIFIPCSGAYVVVGPATEIKNKNW
jgi:hypothetical protein